MINWNWKFYFMINSIQIGGFHFLIELDFSLEVVFVELHNINDLDSTFNPWNDWLDEKKNKNQDINWGHNGLWCFSITLGLNMDGIRSYVYILQTTRAICTLLNHEGIYTSFKPQGEVDFALNSCTSFARTSHVNLPSPSPQHFYQLWFCRFS